MNKIQKNIQSLLNQLVVEADERGLQVAAYIDGKLVVDAYAGIADVTTGQPVTGESLFPVFSVTKGMTATAIHLLAERGKLSYDMKICEVWPEFAANGKEAITLRQALNHTAGLSHMPTDIGHRELCDWDAMCRAIANLKPSTAPGMEMAYHAMTFGWILGEIIRRTDGRPFQTFVQQELNDPLGINSLFAGIPDHVEPLVTLLEEEIEEKQGNELPNAASPQTVPFWVQPLHAWMNRPDARRACVPASNGIMNARAMARHYAALLPGGVDGVELLPPERIRLATERQYPGHGRLEESMLMSLGYHVGDPSSIMGNSHAFGHGGYGGSIAFADPDNRLAFALTKNRFNKLDNGKRIVDELRKEAGF
jgi:CubicO group peptidase (beta-lactamase class C family)